MSVGDLVTLLRHYFPNAVLPPHRKPDLLKYLFQEATSAIVQTVCDVAVARLTTIGELDTSPTDDQRRSTIAQMPLVELLILFQHYFPTAELPASRSKTELLDFFFRNASPSTIQTTIDVVNSRVTAETGSQLQTPPRKRQRRDCEAVVEGPNSSSAVQPGPARISRIGLNEAPDEPAYFELASSDQVKQCYREYYESTHPSSLKRGVCAVCAGEVRMIQSNLRQFNLENVPNLHRLRPHLEHAAHVIFRGALLEPSGVSVQGDTTWVSICADCERELTKHGEQPPRHSLANNLWIGQTPWELSQLTVPEQLLIALLYPRVFVYKLHNKSWTQHDKTRLQRGMRGTVCTYELNADSIASMLQGNLMPRPPAILSSIVVVTFIGREKVTPERVHNLFRVRRRAVMDALIWLKRHNPQYYGGVVIDADRLDHLPVDGIPDEIVSTMRQTPDEALVEQESSPYVPSVDNGLAEVAVDQVDGNEEQPGRAGTLTVLYIFSDQTDRLYSADTQDANVIPLSSNGVFDTSMSSLPATEVITRGLMNLWKQNKEGLYGIRHGFNPVSDFPSAPPSEEGPRSSNLFEKAFPCLYPYGRGGIEAARPVPIELKDHAQWSLRYYDRRFRKHETFPFFAFGILQRREALLSARLQMNRRNFDQDANILATVTREKLIQAQREEQQNVPITDPAVRLLRKSVRGALSRVTGSNEKRCQMRSQIWSTSVYLGPPSLWLTINPSDINNPIAQLFAGEEIDLQTVACIAEAPSRSKAIADDPYAGASFFHFIITAILEKLFQVKIQGHQVKSGQGILGRVAGYFGLVESQGRGSLHLHLLLWLCGTPSSDRIQELLHTDEFRERVTAYIRQNVHAYVPGLETAESIKAIPIDREVSCRGPPCPDALDYDLLLQKDERMLARTEQLHVCKDRCCLVRDSQGRLRCKRRAPFPCSNEAYVLQTGEWGPKRLHGYINGWLPGILVNARCNNDVKLLTNGGDTKNITYYVTTYAAKKQSQSYNLAAVFAQGYNYHQAHPISEYTSQLKENSRLLIFRLVHAINRYQELAAPMVISYLMGWGDVYRSHTYSNIYWTSFVAEILRVFPYLADQAA
jgi:hypothetical protein